jgi:hypothetical protein
MRSRGRDELGEGLQELEGREQQLEESLAPEVAEDALRDDRLHVGDAVGRQIMGLVRPDLVVVGLAEDAVEDDEVVMRVDAEGDDSFGGASSPSPRLGGPPQSRSDGDELTDTPARWFDATLPLPY